MTTATNKIGVITATIVGMNAMIGAGIFSVPAALGSAVGPAGLISYLFVIVAVWCMGSSMAYLAERYPQEGSFYTYARQWGGHTIGLIAGGLYLIGLAIAMGLLCQMIGMYLHHYIVSISPSSLGILTLCVLTILNMIGVHLSQASQMILICTTVFPLIAISILCLIHGSWANFVPFAPYGWKPVLSAARIVIFGFFGFECAASLFTIVENPRKNVPKALVAAIILVGLLYTLFVGSIIFAVPLHYFSDPNNTVSAILLKLFPQYSWVVEVIHLAILSAMIGTVHSMLWSAGSLLTTFLKQLGGTSSTILTHSGYINDRTSILLMASAIFISFICVSDLDLFFSLTSFFIICAFALAMIGLLHDLKGLASWQRLQIFVGLLTAAMILYAAGEDLAGRIQRRTQRVDDTGVKMV